MSSAEMCAAGCAYKTAVHHRQAACQLSDLSRRRMKLPDTRLSRRDGGRVFALLILTSWGLHVFSRHMRTLFLRQNRLELSKGVFTGDGSGLG